MKGCTTVCQEHELGLGTSLYRSLPPPHPNLHQACHPKKLNPETHSNFTFASFLTSSKTDWLPSQNLLNGNKCYSSNFLRCTTPFMTPTVALRVYPANPEGTQVIVGSTNMGYISDTARNRTHKGPSIKYVTLQRGEGSEKVWQFVTGGGGG